METRLAPASRPQESNGTRLHGSSFFSHVDGELSHFAGLDDDGRGAGLHGDDGDSDASLQSHELWVAGADQTHRFQVRQARLQGLQKRGGGGQLR